MISKYEIIIKKNDNKRVRENDFLSNDDLKGEKDNTEKNEKNVDPRLTVLEKSFFENKRVLDIGCNSAFLTVQIAKYFRPSYIEGVDIDPTLINKAFKYLNFQASLMKPVKKSDGEEFSVVDDNKKDFKEKNTSLIEVNKDVDDLKHENNFEYFPISGPLTYGTMPIIKSINATSFPQNVHFRTGDFTKQPLEINQKKYDTIIAFSITKWIHLNEGDSGLKLFFNKIYFSLIKGGIFLMEFQDFDGYKKKVNNFHDKLKSNLKNIKFFPVDFKDFLLNEVGFRDFKFLGKPSQKNFCREIYLFQK
ncbi:hypothetical protein HK099_007293 [Clydaea vesicula]|uniref:RNA methyltransferase n=1 Tax=Clydaea vesicula TaxID=447962 RepID=A0AAD5TYU6_9FUNG|nr:hypothetical protein HK099_007293 [Clydaea vesicula]